MMMSLPPPLTARYLLFWVVMVSLAATVASFTTILPPNDNHHHLAFRNSKRTTTSGKLTTKCYATFDTSGMWNRGLNFGKGQFKYYKGLDSWMSAFPEEDRRAYPELFEFPRGVYEVVLEKPLGIIFEEIELGRGLYVQDLVEGGNAARTGLIQPNDVLVGISAVKVVGAKYERRLIPSRKFDFDTMVGAIESNSDRFNCYDVCLVFERPHEADPAKTDEFMAFFEPPFDNPWKQQQ